MEFIEAVVRIAYSIAQNKSSIEESVASEPANPVSALPPSGARRTSRAPARRRMSVQADLGSGVVAEMKSVVDVVVVATSVVDTPTAGKDPEESELSVSQVVSTLELILNRMSVCFEGRMDAGKRAAGGASAVKGK